MTTYAAVPTCEPMPARHWCSTQTRGGRLTRSTCNTCGWQGDWTTSPRRAVESGLRHVTEANAKDLEPGGPSPF